MGIVATFRSTLSRRSTSGYRELARAVAAAPTRASREELLALASKAR